MTINVAEALCPDTAVIITVMRPTTGQVIENGIVQRNTQYENFTALMSPQQPQYKELQVLPEGERQKDIMKFVSNKPLYTADDRDQRLADLIQWKGNAYKVIYAGDWQTFGHTVVFAVREREEQTGPIFDD